MDMKRAVAITGGASGIGYATAKLLIERGWQVWLLDLKADALETACRTLDLPVSFGLVCDVADEASVEQAMGQILEAEPGLAAIVNCAGTGADKLAVETTIAEFRRILDINLIGSFAVARAAARHWLETGTKGAIVNISSVSGLCGNRGRTAYGASKGGVNLMTLVMANELGHSGIRVNAVAPGPVDTPLTRVVHTENVRNQWFQRVPMERYGTSEEVAGAIAFLISEDASYVNGQILAVDGGFVTAGLAV
ncbi:SDR family NAD(P)-dependent oxidoreductase [Affinirhizobium pseudoryzae]|uniref:SDR family NAD(P)-dependent oxidoreductase n=1 Tax=Allorhizobium pseudoryzae TaxID=379684 RepID=UPI0013ED8376|nr:SDR family NAD(P)-dependent oxidoreductase [Allorhizobium pseudoryzae]